MIKLNKVTKWSDFNTLAPALFILMHGYELLVKGLYILITSNNDYKGHDVSSLINFLERDDRLDEKLIQIILKYSGKKPKNKIISNFLKNNDHLNPKTLVKDIKYPEDMKNKDIDFSNINYQGSELLNEIKNINKDIKKTLELTYKTINYTS